MHEMRTEKGLTSRALVSDCRGKSHKQVEKMISKADFKCGPIRKHQVFDPKLRYDLTSQ